MDLDIGLRETIFIPTETLDFSALKRVWVARKLDLKTGRNWIFTVFHLLDIYQPTC